jgi:WD40 repeat protein
VYDVRQADQLVATITDKKELHRDEVTALKWFKDPRSAKKKYLLLSTSRDGKILVWNALPAKSQLKLYDGFIMLIDFLPRNLNRINGTEMSGKTKKTEYISGIKPVL